MLLNKYYIIVLMYAQPQIITFAQRIGYINARLST